MHSSVLLNLVQEKVDGVISIPRSRFADPQADSNDNIALRLQHLGPPTAAIAPNASAVALLQFPHLFPLESGPVRLMTLSNIPTPIAEPQLPHNPQIAAGTSDERETTSLR